jgi:hypothetical protein
MKWAARPDFQDDFGAYAKRGFVLAVGCDHGSFIAAGIMAFGRAESNGFGLPKRRMCLTLYQAMEFAFPSWENRLTGLQR